MIFRDGTGAVGIQQHHQIVHTGLKRNAFLRLADPHPGLQLFEDNAVVGDVVVAVQGVILACEGLVGQPG